MMLIKNCLNCKYCIPQYYQENLCVSPEVKEPRVDRFGNECGYEYPLTRDVHPDQHLECKFFKMGFWTKVAQIESNLCSKIRKFFKNKGKK